MAGMRKKRTFPDGVANRSNRPKSLFRIDAMDTAGSVVIAESTRRLLGGAFEAQGTRAANAERLRRARFRPGHPGDAHLVPFWRMGGRRMGRFRC